MKKSRGNTSIEWVIVTLAMMVALFAPMPGSEQSLAGLMVQSIQNFYAHGSFIYSLP